MSLIGFCSMSLTSMTLCIAKHIQWQSLIILCLGSPKLAIVSHMQVACIL